MNTKSPVFYSGNEAIEYKNKQLNKIEKINNRINKLQSIYIKKASIENKKKNPKFKKLERIEKKIIHAKGRIQECKIELVYLEKGTCKKLNIFERIIKKLRGLELRKQERLTGYILAIPWITGFVLFFLIPLLKTFYWSLSDVQSIAGGLTIKFTGFKNYVNLFTTQMLGTKTFLEVLWVSISDTLIDVPVIFIFSLLVAVILNSKFRGHQFFKIIFFIPVVYNTVAIGFALSGNTASAMETEASISMLSRIEGFLLDMGMANELITFLISAVDRIFSIVTMSGIQIIIFIAALQSIPSSLYEAAKVEGASQFELFCKITVPMVSRMFLPVLVYSIVDQFEGSELISIMTRNSIGSKISYGVSSAIAVCFFLVNLLIIGVCYLLVGKAASKNE